MGGVNLEWVWPETNMHIPADNQAILEDLSAEINSHQHIEETPLTFPAVPGAIQSVPNCFLPPLGPLISCTCSDQQEERIENCMRGLAPARPVVLLLLEEVLGESCGSH